LKKLRNHFLQGRHTTVNNIKEGLEAIIEKILTRISEIDSLKEETQNNPRLSAARIHNDCLELDKLKHINILVLGVFTNAKH